MLRILVYVVVGIPALMILFHTMVRIVRHFYKFPMPAFLANIIDNPLRRAMQPPMETAARHGITEGMRVLEVGPGNGRYTVAAARTVGNSGQVVTVDIESKMIESVKLRARAEGIQNIQARVANVYDLPFDDNTFDLIYMIAVAGEIPFLQKAMEEFYRVLTPSGTLVFSEMLFDPDYQSRGRLVRMCKSANFTLKNTVGNVFYYTLIFEKNGKRGDA